jgi:hypothetical protein
MPADALEHAYPQNQQRFIEWMAAVPASGLTDPRPALTMALDLRPDVYLLTDGTFPRDVHSDLGGLRQSVAEFNTIVFGDPRAEKSLKPLALHIGGRFIFVPCRTLVLRQDPASFGISGRNRFVGVVMSSRLFFGPVFA